MHSDLAYVRIVADEVVSEYNDGFVYFGITANILWRFFDCYVKIPSMYPHCCKWKRMLVLSSGSGLTMGQYEQDLISDFKHLRCSTNVLRGAEQATDTPTFLYMLMNTRAEHVELAMEHSRNLAIADSLGTDSDSSEAE